LNNPTIFGFFTTFTSEFPANLGLRDQVTALEWIQDNIGAFGGDKNSVTIFGQSAGGLSVSYHTWSPLSRGNFAR
jgi:carboxylesterase type B